MKTKVKIPAVKLAFGSLIKSAVLTGSESSNDPNKATPSADNLDVSTLLKKNGYALIVGPSGSGKLQKAYTAASLSNYNFVEIVNAKKFSASLMEPLVGDVRDFATISPFLTERNDKADRLIVLKEIGYLTFFEQVSIFAFVRSIIEKDSVSKSPFKNLVVLTSTVPITEFGADGANFSPFIDFLKESLTVTNELKQNPSRIPELAISILKRESKRLGKSDIQSFSPDVLEALVAYDWPGNIRELEGVIKVAIVMAKSKILSKTDFALFFKYLGTHTNITK